MKKKDYQLLADAYKKHRDDAFVALSGYQEMSHSKLLQAVKLARWLLQGGTKKDFKKYN